MRKNPRILTIGSATLDLFIGGTNPPLKEIDLTADQKALIVTEGAKFEITDLKGMSGGGATNAARVLHRFGIPVTAFFKTANDQIAEKITTILRSDGIDIRPSINTSTVITGLSVIVPAPSGNKVILSFRGANDTIQEQELPLFFMKGMDGIYVAPLAGKTSELLPKIAHEATENSIRLMLNPSGHQLTEGRETLLRCLKNIDIILLNSSEAKILFNGIHRDGLDIKIAPESNLGNLELAKNFEVIDGKSYSVFDLLATLRTLGPKIILVTNGAEGVYAADESGLHFCPSISTQVVNTVGAGDTFGATFFGAHLSGYDIKTSLLFGALNSTKLLGSTEGIEAVLSAEELEKLAKNV